jgi:hypothetical protein
MYELGTTRVLPLNKKAKEQALMLKIRFQLLMCQGDQRVGSLRRLRAAMDALNDHVNFVYPSRWFEESFMENASFWGGYFWHMEKVNGLYYIAIDITPFPNAGNVTRRLKVVN